MPVNLEISTNASSREEDDTIEVLKIAQVSPEQLGQRAVEEALTVLDYYGDMIPNPGTEKILRSCGTGKSNGLDLDGE